jgi:hypothetical protein
MTEEHSNFSRDIPEEYRPLIQQVILNLLIEGGLGKLADSQPLPHEVNKAYDAWLRKTLE